MATEQGVYDFTMPAREDLSEKQFYWVAGASDKGCELAEAADEDLMGLLQNKPASGRAGEVRRLGISKMLCGGTIAAWDKVTSNATGEGVTASDMERYGAIAMEAGVDGRVISVMMEFGYIEMT